MKRYLGQKLISFVLTIVIANLAAFLILNVLPGDPALLMLGTEGSAEAYARLRSELNLDQPPLVRYFTWLFQFFRGQWGVSVRYSMPVRELVASAFPLSLTLAVLAVGTAVAIAVPPACSAVCPRSPLGRLFSWFTQVGMALPQFRLLTSDSGIRCS